MEKENIPPWAQGREHSQAASYRRVFGAVETVGEEQQAEGFGNVLGHRPPLLVQQPFPDIFS